MADIKLGQSIAAFFTSNDPDGTYANEYDLPGLDSFRQFNITVQRPAGTTTSTTLELIDAATGDILAQTIYSGAGIFSLSETTFPGINYKIRIANASLGDYQLSLTDGGKATSIVSPHTPNVIDRKPAPMLALRLAMAHLTGQ